MFSKPPIPPNSVYKAKEASLSVAFNPSCSPKPVSFTSPRAPDSLRKFDPNAGMLISPGYNESSVLRTDNALIP